MIEYDLRRQTTIIIITIHLSIVCDSGLCVVRVSFPLVESPKNKLVPAKAQVKCRTRGAAGPQLD